jgi:hypothetical protein
MASVSRVSPIEFSPENEGVSSPDIPPEAFSALVDLWVDILLGDYFARHPELSVKQSASDDRAIINRSTIN